jgi:hypothetical protein
MPELNEAQSGATKIGRLGELFLQKGLLTEAQVEQISVEQREKNCVLVMLRLH